MLKKLWKKLFVRKEETFRFVPRPVEHFYQPELPWQ